MCIWPEKFLTSLLLWHVIFPNSSFKCSMHVELWASSQEQMFKINHLYYINEIESIDNRSPSVGQIPCWYFSSINVPIDNICFIRNSYQWEIKLIDMNENKSGLKNNGIRDEHICLGKVCIIFINNFIKNFYNFDCICNIVFLNWKVVWIINIRMNDIIIRFRYIYSCHTFTSFIKNSVSFFLFWFYVFLLFDVHAILVQNHIPFMFYSFLNFCLGLAIAFLVRTFFLWAQRRNFELAFHRPTSL